MHGQEALVYLEDPELDQPDIILLDLMMPVMDGWELLGALHRSDTLKYIPTIALSTSSRQLDIDKAYQAGANAYVVKPVDPAHFQQAVEELGLFWLNRAKLPGIK